MGVVGDVAAEARALGGEYGRSKRDVPIGDTSRFAAIVCVLVANG